MIKRYGVLMSQAKHALCIRAKVRKCYNNILKNNQLQNKLTKQRNT